MIKVNELKIGNWVQAPLGEYMRVTELGHIRNPDYIKAKGEDGFGVNAFSGIPLTEDMLIKCGFEDAGVRAADNRDEPIEWELGYETIKKDGNDFEYELCSDEWGSTLKSVTIKHLHQLQNLYFALTGEELAVEL